jgi:hypothetical protein
VLRHVAHAELTLAYNTIVKSINWLGFHPVRFIAKAVLNQSMVLTSSPFYEFLCRFLIVLISNARGIHISNKHAVPCFNSNADI